MGFMASSIGTSVSNLQGQRMERRDCDQKGAGRAWGAAQLLHLYS